MKAHPEDGGGVVIQTFWNVKNIQYTCSFEIGVKPKRYFGNGLNQMGTTVHVSSKLFREKFSWSPYHIPQKVEESNSDCNQLFMSANFSSRGHTKLRAVGSCLWNARLISIAIVAGAAGDKTRPLASQPLKVCWRTLITVSIVVAQRSWNG